MNKITFDSISDLLGDIFRASVHAARVLLATIAAMPWPQLLASCVLLALVLTILPLAFTLFVVFMLVKLVVAAIVVQSRRNRSHHEG